MDYLVMLVNWKRKFRRDTYFNTYIEAKKYAKRVEKSHLGLYAYVIYVGPILD